MSTAGADQENGNLPDFEYDVALSFAEEDRAFVAAVAARLRWRNIKAYYYKDANNDADLWGTDLYHHLRNIYQHKSRFCVMFISRYYKEKFWTQREQEWVKARDLINQKGEYILPFRFDDTEVDGIKPTIHFLSVKQYDAKRLARVIEAKVRDRQKRKPLPWYGFLAGMDLSYNIGRYLWQKHGKVSFKAGVTLFIVIIGFLFRDNLTPPDRLEKILYRRHVRVVHGSVCRDGSFSESQGQGACSHHGGVAGPKDSLMPGMSPEACRDAAREISIIP